MNKEIRNIENFWDNNLCGHHFVESEYLSKKFFEEYTNFRYAKTHHLLKYIDWQSASGKDVLEIGLGIGADATLWAKYAKSYTGIDLTDEAVKATQIHLQLRNLNGNIRKDNAEKMIFDNNSFDIVYSHGVLHHIHSIENAFKDVFRVLRKDGVFIVMLYSKSSFNYWIRIQGYFRLRMLFEIIKNRIGEKNKGIWNDHINNYNKYGIKYISWNEFPHHCTDGANCEIANIYWTTTITKLLKNVGFEVLQTKKAHFPIGGKYPKLERFIAKYIGFHQLYWAKKV